MNILHLSTPKTWRGGEQQVYWLFEEIATQTKHNQLLVCPSGSVMQQKCIENEWNHEALKSSHHFNPKMIQFFAKICQQNKIDIVHLHDAHALNIGILASTLLGLSTPLIFTRRVDFELKKNWFTRFKYNHYSLKKIICVSEEIKTVIAPDIKNKTRLTTIHSGVDVERFNAKLDASTSLSNRASATLSNWRLVTERSRSNEIAKISLLKKEFSIDEDSLLIGNASALSDHKDLITFVEVANIVLQKTKQKIHFVLIGEGKERSEIEEKIKTLNLQKHITLTGFRHDIPQILPELAIFLMTSKEEGLGTTVLDAMAANVAVVSTNAGGLPESVIHNKTGLLADIKDIETLSQHVLQLIENPNLRNELAKNAKLNVKQNFSKQLTAQKVLAVYEEVLES